MADRKPLAIVILRTFHTKMVMVLHHTIPATNILIPNLAIAPSNLLERSLILINLPESRYFERIGQ